MLFGAQIKEFPSQKKTLKEKDIAWRKECVDAAESLIFFQNSGIRQRRLQKKVNYDLYNDIVNKADMERIVNPFGIKIDEFPTEPRNYNIINPYVKTLLGEEIKRRFDWDCVTINSDAISDKEEEVRGQIIAYLKSVVEKELNGQKVPDEEIDKKIKYLKYNYRDMRELSATRLLEYYTRHLNIKELYTRGWEDFLLVGEEIYAVDEVNGEPDVRRCNPLNTYFLTAPNTNKVEDSDIVVEENYEPLGKVIDAFYEYLSADEIEMISRKQGPTATNDSVLGYSNKPMTFLDTEVGANNYIDTDNVNFATIGGAYDNQGNVRVVRVCWRSMRKVGILTDPNGDKDIVSEEFVISPEFKAMGYTIKWIWINEAWEGTKIAGHIYVKMEPRKVQFRELDNYSKCSLGYVGTLCNTNSNRVLSFYDICKPYQYSYNAYAYRLELANIKSYGRIGELDLAEIPDGWSEDMYLYYATMVGFRIKDSFKESKKGAATGKLVGTVSSPSSGVMDMEQRAMIDQGLKMLQYIDQQLASITGINRQRQGQISSEAGLGITQEAKEASATITEWYFKLHDSTKVRVLKHLLEVAKYSVRNGNKKIQNVIDSMTTAIYTIDGNVVNEAEYGILVSDASQDQRTLQALQQGVQAAVQSGAVDFVQMINIYANSSMSSIKAKLEEAEEAKQQAQQQQVQHEQEIQKQQQDLAERMHQEELQQRELDRQLKQYQIDTEAQTKIQVATITALGFSKDTDDILAQSKLSLEEKKHLSEAETKHLVEENKLRMHKEKLELEHMKLESQERMEQMKTEAENLRTKQEKENSIREAKLKEKEIAAKKSIAKSKPKGK